MPQVMKRYCRLLRRVFDHYSSRDRADHSADAQKFLSLSEFEAMAREFALYEMPDSLWLNRTMRYSPISVCVCVCLYVCLYSLPGVAEIDDLRDVFAASIRQGNSHLGFRDFVECLTRLALTVYRSSDRFESSEQKLSSLFRAMHLDRKDIVLHRFRIVRLRQLVSDDVGVYLVCRMQVAEVASYNGDGGACCPSVPRSVRSAGP